MFDCRRIGAIGKWRGRPGVEFVDVVGPVLYWGALWLSLVAAPVAGPEQLRLEWQAPPSCPDTTQVHQMIIETLGDVDPEQLRPVAVRATLRPATSETFVLRMELEGGGAGTRELSGPSCVELSDAAALVIAMAIDPRLLERLEVEPPERTEPSEVPTPAREEPALPEPTDVEDPTPAEIVEPEVVPSPSPLDFVAHFGGGGGYGPLPRGGGVAAVGLGVAGPGWRAEFVGSYWPPSTGQSNNNPAVGVRAQLWNVGLQGCGEPTLGPVSIPLCLGVLAGAVHAVGTGELEPVRVASRWGAITAEPSIVWWARPRLGIALRTRGHVAVVRPDLRSEPSGTIHTSSLFGGSVRVGLELRLR